MKLLPAFVIFLLTWGSYLLQPVTTNVTKVTLAGCRSGADGRVLNKPKAQAATAATKKDGTSIGDAADKEAFAVLSSPNVKQ
ncbi:hypothetical protein [Hymenobacter crusticola]|uniref:Uncharacterized protein n=1 Tax=Hymenobacter crusticola TaxID=1770526 RepID=A0A243WGY7_9BACT|nr:hypothetical protein [Hymenobacter crusticola]OUJ74221.1 hypothetical protein BXP70_10870 [Hymenobacter crusticola]